MVPPIRLRDALLFTTATSAFVVTHTVTEMSITERKVIPTQIDKGDGGSAPKFDDVTTVGLTTVTVFGSGSESESNSVGVFEIDSTTSALPVVATSASASEVTLFTANATDAIPSNFTTYTTLTNTSVALTWTTDAPTSTGGAESTKGNPVPEPTESSKKGGAAELSSPFERSAKAIIMGFLVALAL